MHRTELYVVGVAVALLATSFTIPGWAASGLDMPTGFRAEAGDGQVSLTWNAVADATGYRYRQKATGGFAPWTAVPGSTATTTRFVVRNLVNGTTYTFKLRAVRRNKKGPATAAAEATPRAPALPAPAGLTASGGNGSVSLSWSAVAGATGYDYQRRAGSAPYGPWQGVGTATSTALAVTGLANGTIYGFKVRATRSGGAGPASAEATATPRAPLTAPRGFAAAPSDRRVTLSWQAVAGATGYQHRWRKSSDGHRPWAAASTSTATTYAVSTLSNGEAYAFQVRAVRGAEHGPATAEATTTPFAPCGESADAALAGDCETLLAAKSALDVGGVLNWRRSQALREWAGVTVAAGRVTGLRLANLGLDGQIPASLSRLTQLNHLDLCRNRLSGGLPAQLANLRQLKTLRLCENDLDGTLPSWLGSLNNLERLDLHLNGFSGAIPTTLGSLTRLKKLQLGGNAFTGAIPTTLGALRNLEELVLYGNRLTGAIPNQLASLTKLSALSLSINELSGTLPAWLGSLTDLQHLHLHHNNFSGAIPNLRRLTKLKALGIGGTGLTAGPVPAWIRGLTQLQTLWLPNANRTGTLPSMLFDKTRLETLDPRRQRLLRRHPRRDRPPDQAQAPEPREQRLQRHRPSGARLAARSGTSGPRRQRPVRPPRAAGQSDQADPLEPCLQRVQRHLAGLAGFADRSAAPVPARQPVLRQHPDGNRPPDAASDAGPGQQLPHRRSPRRARLAARAQPSEPVPQPRVPAPSPPLSARCVH